MDNVWLNSGKISSCRPHQNGFWWELPNYFAYDHDPAIAEQIPPFCIRSPCFTSFGCEWRLELIQNGSRKDSKDLGFFLWKTSQSKTSSPFDVYLSLVDSSGGVYYFIKGVTDVTGGFGAWRFIKVYTLFTNRTLLSPAGILRFYCEISKKPEVVDVVPETSVVDVVKETNSDLSFKSCEDDERSFTEDKKKAEIPETKGVDKLLQDLKNLFLNGQSSDFVFKVEEREFRVHRGILTVRSPVFASMLQHDTKENSTGIVDIPDCAAEAFQIFLAYVYTGSVDTISPNNVCDLYYIADKYQVNDVKSECVEFMEKNLCVENFCEIMTLSLQHSESSLQQTATRFFCEHVKIIIKTVKWQKYMKDHTTVANELYIKAIGA